MKFIGVDLSIQGTGLAVLSDDGVYTKEITSKKTDVRDVVRFDEIIRNIFSACLFDPDDFVILENYAFAASGQITRIAELCGCFKHALWLVRDVTPERLSIVSPQTLKLFVTGKGIAKKEMMLKEVYKRWKIDTQSNNVADAFGAAKLLKTGYLYVNNFSDDIPDFQKRAVESMFKQNKELEDLFKAAARQGLSLGGAE
jgi:crossover junction endodeoxyribonuclease RuvC